MTMTTHQVTRPMMTTRATKRIMLFREFLMLQLVVKQY
jgi:hypothetical protein